MVAAEHAAAREICQRLDAHAAAAEAARADKAALVDELKATHRTRLSALRCRLGSEVSVLAEQAKYVSSLEARLRDEEMQCVDGAAAESAKRRGEALVVANAGAAATFLHELKLRLECGEAALAEARRARDADARQSDAEAKRLVEQKAATADALRKLGGYEASLTSNLSDLPQPTTKAPSSTASAPPSTVWESDVVAVDQPHRLSSELPKPPELVLNEGGAKRGSLAAAAESKARPQSPDEVSTRLEAV